MLLIFHPIMSYSQKFMLISDELLQNSDRFSVELKGGGSMFKFQFGSYKVVSSKGGWTKSKYNSKLFSAYETATSDRAISFVFVSAVGDSAIVNLNRNMKYEGFNDPGFTFNGKNSSLTIGGYQEILESSDNLFGIIESNLGDSVWNLVVTEKFGSRIGGQSPLVGWLTDGQRKIDIYPVFQYQSPGKKNLIDLMLGSEIWLKGFEFFEKGTPLGAVQVGPMKKLFIVWFSKNNDPTTNFVMGSSFAALMHEYQMDINEDSSDF